MKVAAYIKVLDAFWARNSTTGEKGKKGLKAMTTVRVEEIPAVAQSIKGEHPSDVGYDELPPDAEMPTEMAELFRQMCAKLEEIDPGGGYSIVAGLSQ